MDDEGIPEIWQKFIIAVVISGIVLFSVLVLTNSIHIPDVKVA